MHSTVRSARSATAVEVIVVDDGSTDESRAVIDRYAGSCPGHPPAEPGPEGRVQRRVRGRHRRRRDVPRRRRPPRSADRVDRGRGLRRSSPPRRGWCSGSPSSTPKDAQAGGCVPAAAMPLPHGDVRAMVLAFPDDLAWPPTSGNAFAAWALHKVMPLRVDDERVDADHDLHTLIPLLGPVGSLPDIGGSYRVHGANAVARADCRRRSVARHSAGEHSRSHTALAELAAEPRLSASRSSLGDDRRASARVSPLGRTRAIRFRATVGGRALRDGLRAAVGPLRRSGAPASGLCRLVHCRDPGPEVCRAQARRRGVPVDARNLTNRSRTADHSDGLPECQERRRSTRPFVRRLEAAARPWTG